MQMAQQSPSKGDPLMLLMGFIVWDRLQVSINKYGGNSTWPSKETWTCVFGEDIPWALLLIQGWSFSWPPLRLHQDVNGERVIFGHVLSVCDQGVPAEDMGGFKDILQLYGCHCNLWVYADLENQSEEWGPLSCPSLCQQKNAMN